MALYEVGALGPSEKLFKAARRLDPALADVTRNAGAGRAAACGPCPPPCGWPCPHSGTALMRSLRARPAQGLSLSLCMIGKDEEEMLPRCLEAARPAVDEIIVVDTGSSDRTAEIALVGRG